jgi:hypothetical protein
MGAFLEFQNLVATALTVEDDYEQDPTPAYLAVLTQIEKHPELREAFGRELLATLDAGSDGGLFMFCLGTLRWPEVEADLRRQFEASPNPHNMRPHFFYASCLRCFDEGYEV